MAALIPPIPPSENDPFSEVEEKIRLKFNDLIEAVTRRREHLLTELRALRDSNLEIVHEIDELETSKAELTQCCREMRANVAKLEMEKSIQKLEQQITDLRNKLQSSSVEIELSCDTHKLEEAIAGLGEICVKKVEQRDYSLIKSPLFRASKSGSKAKQLNNPFGLCIDDSTDLVYIADRNNKRIQVWTMSGDYLSTFGELVLKNPYKITSSKGGLFVSDNNQNAIFKFHISTFSLLARSDCKLVYACAICTEADEVFIVNNYTCITVFNTDLTFLRNFTDCIRKCFDIKIKNSVLYALEADTNQIQLLDSNTGDSINTVITNRDGVNFVNTCHFCLDQSDNFLITNWKSNQIKIVSGNGTLLRLIDTSEWELSKPQGIGMSIFNKIAIVFGIGIFCQI